MSDFRSALDVMKSAISSCAKADYIMGRVISRKLFSGSSKYQYCPFCIERVKRAGLDFKQELRPLWIVRCKELYVVTPTEGRVIYNTYWECGVCKDLATGKARRITLDDFCTYYVKPKNKGPVKSPWVDLTDKRALENF